MRAYRTFLPTYGMPRMSRSHPAPSLVRPLMASLWLVCAATIAHAEPVADVHALAQKAAAAARHVARSRQHRIRQQGCRGPERHRRARRRPAQADRRHGGDPAAHRHLSPRRHAREDRPGRARHLQGHRQQEGHADRPHGHGLPEGHAEGPAVSHQRRQGLRPRHRRRQAGRRAHSPYCGDAAEAEFQGLWHAHGADQWR